MRRYRRFDTRRTSHDPAAASTPVSRPGGLATHLQNAMTMTTEMQKQRVVVIGAGPTGLGAAHRLAEHGNEVTVVEADGIPGGLAGTLRVDGFGFDFGGHRLVTRDERVVSFARELLDADLLESTRLSRILFQGRYWSQPLEIADAMRSVRPAVAIRAMTGYLWAEVRRAAGRLRRSRKKERSFEEWVVARFGRPLYEMFFEPYTRKVWGVDPGLIAASWAPRRIMVAGLGALIKSLLIAEARRPATTARRYLYPRLGAGQLYDRLAQRCEDLGATFQYGTRATSVMVEPDRIVVGLRREGVDSTLEADAVISTAPLPQVISMLSPTPPADVLAAAGKLGYRGIVFVFLRLARSLAIGWDNLYVPEPDYVFFRAEEPLFWSRDLVPPGHTSLCLEIAASPGDTLWEADDDRLARRCIEDLNRMGFVVAPREVLGCDVVRRAAVYPLRLVDTAAARRACLRYVDTLGPRVQSVGRQGAFRYVDMDQAIAMGWDAADTLLGTEGLGSGVEADDLYLWDPRRKLAGLTNG